ncbi:MAG TPA: hypothetical protein DEP05_03290 [Betaproteobacteria bacterium]|nr:hypothetical protein [Betaproteobacteria bacterium]
MATTIAIVCEHQEKSNWCWAAVVASVNNYYAAKFSKRATITQTELATKYVGGRDEAYDPFTALVDLDLSNGTDVGLIDWDALKSTVGDAEPNIAKVQGAAGHYILVIGYDDPSTARHRRYAIADPHDDPAAAKTLTKSELESYDGGYAGTQYTKEKK